MFWPCETSTSTCRSFATISSGVYLFFGIAVLLHVKRHSSARTTFQGEDHKEILVPSNSGAQPRRVDRELVLALARARSWMRALRLGEFIDTAEIAQRFALSNPHVRRLLRFTYLAPDIVEAIVEGRQPRILTVKLLLTGIPLDWADQRAAFGFH